jgi:hypothetical protein
MINQQAHERGIPAPADLRIETVVRLLMEADLRAQPATARETVVVKQLSSALAGVPGALMRTAVGVDGSTRKPDDARLLPAITGSGPGVLAIEYKLYRDRKHAAGEMDRALGQCAAYAEKYDAVLFFVVYMGAPRDLIPAHWLDRTVPFRVGHRIPGVPIYFAARPRDWDAPWATQFAR